MKKRQKKKVEMYVFDDELRAARIEKQNEQK